MIIAPDFAPDALALLQKKKNLRLLKLLKSPALRVLRWRCAAWGRNPTFCRSAI